MLPMQDSLHMPPSGKLQLDAEEIKLIAWWINAGAHAHEKYASMPKADSIHPFMLSRFQPKTGLDLMEIPFADQEEIKSLKRALMEIGTAVASAGGEFGMFNEEKTPGIFSRLISKLSGLGRDDSGDPMNVSATEDSALNDLRAVLSGKA